MKRTSFVNPRVLLLALTIAPFAIPAKSHAELLTYEGFNVPADYSSGSSISGGPSNGNGGSGWTGAWSVNNGTINANAIGLTYTNSGTLLNSMGAATLPSNFNFNLAARTFAPISTGNLWVSWLYSPGSPGTDYSGLGLTQTGGGELFYIGTDGDGQFRVDASVGGGSNGKYGALTLGAHFVAVNVNFTNGSLDVYFDPALAGGPGAPIASFANLNTQEVRSLLFLGNGNGVTSFDEIRLGTSFADVAPVPEPATYFAGIGGAVVMFLKLRRRRLHPAGA